MLMIKDFIKLIWWKKKIINFIDKGEGSGLAL